MWLQTQFEDANAIFLSGVRLTFKPLHWCTITMAWKSRSPSGSAFGSEGSTSSRATEASVFAGSLRVAKTGLLLSALPSLETSFSVNLRARISSPNSPTELTFRSA